MVEIFARVHIKGNEAAAQPAAKEDHYGADHPGECAANHLHFSEALVTALETPKRVRIHVESRLYCVERLDIFYMLPESLMLLNFAELVLARVVVVFHYKKF